MGYDVADVSRPRELAATRPGRTGAAVPRHTEHGAHRTSRRGPLTGLGGSPRVGRAVPTPARGERPHPVRDPGGTGCAVARGTAGGPVRDPDGAGARRLAVLRADRGAPAARLLPALTGRALREGRRRGLPSGRGSRVARCGPRPVPARGAGGRRAGTDPWPSRSFSCSPPVAVDALLLLTARGPHGEGRLGHDVAGLAALGTVEPNRLADAARSASVTGAHAAT